MDTQSYLSTLITTLKEYFEDHTPEYFLAELYYAGEFHYNVNELKRLSGHLSYVQVCFLHRLQWLLNLLCSDREFVCSVDKAMYYNRFLTKEKENACLSIREYLENLVTRLSLSSKEETETYENISNMQGDISFLKEMKRKKQESIRADITQVLVNYNRLIEYRMRLRNLYSEWENIMEDMVVADQKKAKIIKAWNYAKRFLHHV